MKRSILFALDERIEKLKCDWYSFQAANIEILCGDKSDEFDKEKFDDENDEKDALCLALKAKMRAKMSAFSNKPNSVAAGKNLGLESFSEKKKADNVIGSGESLANKKNLVNIGKFGGTGNGMLRHSCRESYRASGRK